MSFHPRKQFADMTGLTPGNLSNYITRGKVILSGDFIDDTIPVNIEFIKRRKELMLNKKTKRKPPAKTKTQKPDNPSKPNIQAPAVNLEAVDIPGADDFKDVGEDPSLQTQKTEADIERIKTVTELNRMRIAKQEGELLPTELMLPIIKQMAIGLTSAFKNAAETLIIEISHKKKLTADESADLRKRLTYVINSSVNDGVDEAKMNTDRIVTDFSKSRTAGQRK